MRVHPAQGQRHHLSGVGIGGGVIEREAVGVHRREGGVFYICEQVIYGCDAGVRFLAPRRVAVRDVVNGKYAVGPLGAGGIHHAQAERCFGCARVQRSSETAARDGVEDDVRLEPDAGDHLGPRRGRQLPVDDLRGHTGPADHDVMDDVGRGGVRAPGDREVRGVPRLERRFHQRAGSRRGGNDRQQLGAHAARGIGGGDAILAGSADRIARRAIGEAVAQGQFGAERLVALGVGPQDQCLGRHPQTVGDDLIHRHGPRGLDEAAGLKGRGRSSGERRIGELCSKSSCTPRICLNKWSCVAANCDSII